MHEQFEQMLEQIKQARLASVPRYQLHSEMHNLAEARYEPALAYFLTFLMDEDWDWRLEGVQLVGFHYDFAPNSHIAAQLRHLLLTDPSDFVRSAAAFALGGRSAWPDLTLFHALQTEPDIGIAHDIFAAILQVAGVPFPKMRKEVEEIVKNNIRPDLATVEKILGESTIDLNVPKG